MSSKRITLAEAFASLENLGAPDEPITASELATELNCPPLVASKTLDELVERGDVKTKTVGGGTRVWWVSSDPESSNHAQFRSLVGTVEEYAIFLLDPDGYVVTWNEGARQIKGYDAEEIVGKHFSKFYTEEDTERGIPQRNLEQAREHGQTEDEGWRLCEDGSRFWANVTITAVRDDDGTLTGFTKVTRDMTERREYEQQLQQERDLIKEILNTAPVSLSVRAEDGTILHANQRAQRFFGLSEEEIKEGPEDPDGWDFYDGDGEPVTPENSPTARALASGEPVFDEEIAVEKPNGERRWFSVNAAPVYDSDGNLERVVTASEDVTYLKEREQQLETELSEILGRVSDAFYALDEEWRFTHVNDQAEELMQLSEAEVLGKSIWDVFPDTADTALWENFHEAMETQESTSFEIYYQALDTWVEFNAYPSETGLSVYFRDVSERVKYERALAESERRYRTLAEHFPNGSVVLFDHDLRYTLVEGTLSNQLGIEGEEMVGSRVGDAHPSEVRATFECHYRAALDGEESSFEVDYGDRILRVQAIPVRDADGEVFAGMGMSQDVTERVEQRRALEKSEQRYRVLAEHFPDGAVGLYDDDLRFSLVEGAIFDDLERTAGDLEGHTVAEVFPAETSDALEPLFRNALDGETNSIEVEFIGRTFEIWTAPVRDADGEIFAGLSFAQDISERVERERELEQYETIIETVNDGVYTVDEDGYYTMVNETYARMTGYSPEELVGSHVSLVVGGEIRERINRLERGLRRGERDTGKVEMDILPNDGEAIRAEATFALLPSGERVGVVRDITERKERERKLDRFASVVSHDLRNPLGIAQGYLTMARDEGDSDDFDEVQRALDRMETIIRNLLTMAREGQTVTESNPVSLSNVAENAWRYVDTAEATLRVDETSRTILADENRLQTAFENLFRNAVEHGRDDVEVRVGLLTDDGDGATGTSPDGPVDGLYVEDDGSGIPPEKRSEVFEYGYSPSHGTGLGLAIVREIVEAHEWEITVTDSASGGARFEIRGVETAGDATDDRR
ncbi:PAS domain S-box protein [Haladaptatus salinisoli]|uniref:PAS domain S-box protein n=1 Tax=Haladaptatus salinisoli TaxID=2884876 RepID=UPI001D0AA015|nr:PAS domain S-box protein [Haladaptatus salinisoli]